MEWRMAGVEWKTTEGEEVRGAGEVIVVGDVIKENVFVEVRVISWPIQCLRRSLR